MHGAPASPQNRLSPLSGLPEYWRIVSHGLRHGLDAIAPAGADGCARQGFLSQKTRIEPVISYHSTQGQLGNLLVPAQPVKFIKYDTH